MINNYKQLQSLILASEGKTLEDELCYDCLDRGFAVCSENRGIDLARVLKALGKNMKITLEYGVGVFQPRLTIWIAFGNSKELHWNLDYPLHLQSEETITKLIELLK